MQKIEGIILSKRAIRDNDCLCHVLLRNGLQVSLIFYGGRGSSRKKTTSIELGHMISVFCQTNAKGVRSDVYIAKNTQLIWAPAHIRNNYKSFGLMCFYLELLTSIASPCDEADFLEHVGEEGLFKVLSNALFYLDQAVKEKCFKMSSHQVLFLTKLLHELGLLPDLNSCQSTGELLSEKKHYHFDKSSGGFLSVYGEEIASRDELVDHYWSKQVRECMLEGIKTNYGQYQSLAARPIKVAEEVFDFLLMHTGREKGSFKTLSLAFVD